MVGGRRQQRELPLQQAQSPAASSTPSSTIPTLRALLHARYVPPPAAQPRVQVVAIPHRSMIIICSVSVSAGSLSSWLVKAQLAAERCSGSG